MSHATKSGVATFVAPDEKACLDEVRYLLSFLPVQQPGGAAARVLRRRPRPRGARAHRPHARLAQPALRHEAGHRGRGRRRRVPRGPRHWAMSITCGFARIDGRVVGIVGNQPAVLAGVLDIDSSREGGPLRAHLRRLQHPARSPSSTCPGFMPGTDQEYGGIIRHGAKLLYAYCESTVPRIQIITRKAYGGAYVVMNSKSIGADLAFAWPSAELAVMGPNGAVEIVYRRELAEAADPVARRAELVDEYTERYANPYIAAERGYIDDVISPADTRARHLPQPRHPGLQARGAAQAQARQRAAVSGPTSADRGRPQPTHWPAPAPVDPAVLAIIAAAVDRPGPARRWPTSTTRSTRPGASAAAGGTSRSPCGATGPGEALTVYVDDWRQRATIRDREDRWSHLLADEPEELHAMAACARHPPPGLSAAPPLGRPGPLRRARVPPPAGHRAGGGPRHLAPDGPLTRAWRRAGARPAPPGPSMMRSNGEVLGRVDGGHALAAQDLGVVGRDDAADHDRGVDAGRPQAVEHLGHQLEVRAREDREARRCRRPRRAAAATIWAGVSRMPW